MAKASKEEQRKAPILRFKGFTDNWEQRKLLKVCKKEDNKRIPIKEQERKEGDTPYFGANGIQGYIDGYTHDGTNILIAEDGANNVKNYPIKLITGKIWVNNHAHVLNVNTKINNGNFLVGAIKKINFYRYLVGSSRYKLTAESLNQVKIKIAKQSEQEKIGELLKDIEELLTLYERKVRLYKLIFKKAINSIVNVSSSSEISLGNIFDVITDYVANGSFKSLRENVKHYSSEEYAYLIRLQDFNNHWKGPWLYTDKKGFDFLKKSKLQTGDIILSNVGSVGKIFQVPSLDKPMTLAPNSILLKTEKNNEDYMYYLMLSSNFQRKLKEKVTPGVQEKINKTDLKKIKIKLPSKNQQDSIAELLKTINSYIKHLQQKASYLKDIKKELLNTMFI